MCEVPVSVETGSQARNYLSSYLGRGSVCYVQTVHSQKAIRHSPQFEDLKTSIPSRGLSEVEITSSSSKSNDFPCMSNMLPPLGIKE